MSLDRRILNTCGSLVLALVLLLGIALVSVPRMTAQEHPLGSITIDRIADVKYPTDQAWSPDSKTVAFLWDAAGKQDLYMAQPGSPPVALTDFPVDPDILTSDISHFEWASADEVIFDKDGNLWTVSIASRKPTRLAGYQDVTSFSLSSDRRQIAYVHGGQIWVGNLAGKTQRQLTRISDGSVLSSPIFSLDSNYVAFNANFFSDTPQPMPFNGNRLIAMRMRVWGTRLGIVSVFSGDPVLIPTSGAGTGSASGGPAQWANGAVLIHNEFSPDHKTREIVETTVSGESHTVWKDYDPLYYSPSNGPNNVISPDGKYIAFMSDRTGWAHLYVIAVDATSETQAKQLGKGDFGDCYANWSPDSKSVVFAHSEVGNQQERFISIADVATGKIQPVVTARGVNYGAVFSPDGAKLAYLRSAVEHPQEVYAVNIAAGSKPIRLTDSLPEGLNPADLTAPVAVHYPSRKDGKSVPATLIVNKNLDKSTKHPAIIWIHGTGSDQNYLAWHPGGYRMYYGACEYLAQQGYVILTPDYRGSSGYSRDWTTASYHDVGDGDTQDVNAGADYLKTLSYVDPNRIGVWGLSYGGWSTLQSIITAPKLFAAAIDVAGVSEWETSSVNGGGDSPRMGATAVSDPEFYDHADPVRHLDKIETPLLILQGTNDTNVPPWQTLEVVDRLEKLGTPFDMAFYTGEIHFFRRAYVLRDAWRRSEAFFDLHLKAPLVPPNSSDASPSAKIDPKPVSTAAEAR
jgi:dipeptidyl aminopeptidase/acylaminoacyl peptidase